MTEIYCKHCYDLIEEEEVNGKCFYDIKEKRIFALYLKCCKFYVVRSDKEITLEKYLNYQMLK